MMDKQLRPVAADPFASVGTLASGLAHEIRNPLNGALLHLTYLRRRLREHAFACADVLDAVDVAENELKRVSLLVTEFLEYAAPQAIEVRTIDAREVLAAARVRELDSAAGVDVVVDVPETPLRVTADRERLVQAVANLLANARDAVAADVHPVPRVTLRARLQQDLCVLEIEDDGGGVTADAERIFDPFFSTKPNGTGLGLSVARRIATDHGGSLTFSSVPGHTVFAISLPAHTQDRA